MRITRRHACSAAALVGGAAALTLSAAMLPIWPSVGHAQEPSNDDLMAKGPLDDEAEGRPDAPVTIVEYASMTCPHCAKFHTTVYPTLKSRYIDTGKVRFIFREFPLDPLAAAGSMLARCAGSDDKYFAMIDALFQQQKEWVVQKPLDPLLAIAKQAGFTQESFNACLADQKILDGIEQVRRRAAEKLGVNSTPTFFINGKVQRGEMTVEELDKLIQPYLRS